MFDGIAVNSDVRKQLFINVLCSVVCLFIALFTYSFHQLIIEASRCHVSVLSGRLMSAAGERATGSTFIPQCSDVAVISQDSDMLFSFNLFPFARIWILALHPRHLPVPPLISLFSQSLCHSMSLTRHASLITPPVILPICICNYYRKELQQASEAITAERCSPAHIQMSRCNHTGIKISSASLYFFALKDRLQLLLLFFFAVLYYYYYYYYYYYIIHSLFFYFFHCKGCAVGAW